MKEPWEWNAHTHFAELIEAAVRLRVRIDVAATTLDQLKDTTEPSGSDWAIGIQRRCEALVSSGSYGRGSLPRVDRSVRAQSPSPGSRSSYRTHLLYGEWLRRQSRPGRCARAHLRAAHVTMTGIGMNAFAVQAARATNLCLREPGRPCVGQNDPRVPSDETHAAGGPHHAFLLPMATRTLEIRSAARSSAHARSSTTCTRCSASSMSAAARDFAMHVSTARPLLGVRAAP